MQFNSTSSSRLHSLFIDEDGYAWVCGKNINGCLGVSNISKIQKPYKIEGLNNLIGCCCGANFSMLLHSNGDIYSCGSNIFGQIGHGKGKEQINNFTKVNNIPSCQLICAREYFSFILDDNGRIWSTGYNNSGQLGLGDTKNRFEYTLIKNIPKIQNISLGSSYTLLLDENGDVWGSGLNNYCQFSKEVGTFTSFIQLKDKNLPPIKQISCYHESSLFLDELGIAYISCDGMFLKKIEYVPEIQYCCSGFNCFYILDIENNIWVEGTNTNGELTISNDNINDITYSVDQLTKLPHKFSNPLRYIVSGNNRCFFIEYTGEILGCGNNFTGALGLQTLDDIYIPTYIKLPRLYLPSFSQRQKSARK